MIEGIDFIEMMLEFGRLVILRIENPYNMLWRIGEIRHIGRIDFIEMMLEFGRLVFFAD